VNPVPVRTTSSPGTPDACETADTFGGGLALRMKLLIVDVVPPGPTIVIPPVVAPARTTD
jgi:hypothetical protein